jgi:hypothetical protein
MEIFEYVIVLTSIVIGLAVTHLMQGIAGLVQHPGKDKVWWVHLGWVAFWLLTSIFWWWWEFRLQQIHVWTFQLYLFVTIYAFTIYLICALLFPSNLEGYEGYRDYLLSRRRWIYGLMLFALTLDVFDTLVKGIDYFLSLGASYVIVNGLFALVCLASFLSRRNWVHGAGVLIALAMQAVRVIAYYDTIA